MDNAYHLKRLGSLQSAAERQNFESLWQSGGDFCNPENSDIQTVSTKGQRRRVARITDVGIEASRRFSIGMYSYAIGTGKFFSYQASDPKLMDNDEVRRYFSEVDTIIHNALLASNFGAEVLQSFRELSYIGTSATYIEWYKGGLNFKTQHISRFWIDVDARGQVNTMYVEIPLKASQLVAEFGKDKMPVAVLRSVKEGEDAEHTVVQVCYENPDHKEDSIKQEDQQFISKYMLKEDGSDLRVDGHSTFPFAVARLYKAKNEMYGRCCYMEAAQTISLHNDQQATLIRGAKNRADPPWIEAADSRVRHIRTNGISRIIYDPSALGGAPTQMDIKSDVGITMEMMDRSQEYIFRAFYVQAFNPLEDRKNMTAFEASQHIDMGLSEVSPLQNKWQSEFATPAMTRVFDIMNKKGKLPDMPSVLEGKDYKLEYTSKAALALKQIEMYGITSTFERAIGLQPFVPDVMDNLDADEAIRLGATVDNVPNSVIRASDAVKGIRKQRANDQENQQMIENAPVMADAALKADQIGKQK